MFGGRLAPASGHMVHMPGHIYFRIGDYARAAQSFASSLAVDERYMREQHISRHELNDEHGYGIRVIALHTEDERHATFVRASCGYLSGFAWIETVPRRRWTVMRAGETQARAVKVGE